jgi:2-methylcitrate dehydratase PrpD
VIGAAASAAALHQFDAEKVRYALSYAAQQASGVPFWNRDRHHVEKAFDFGGMAARNGVFSTAMVASGFSATDDPLGGPHNLFTAFAEAPDPQQMVAELGQRFEVQRASIKKWCVGSPIQAVLDALAALIDAHGVRAAEATRIMITMPDDRIHIVDNRTMPDVCVQHLAAVMLIDGGLTFETTHDSRRMSDQAVLDVRSRIQLVPSRALTNAVPARQAIVDIACADGRKLHHHAKAVRGTPENPMTVAEIEAKAIDLMAPIIGVTKAQAVVAMVRTLEQQTSLKPLCDLLVA